MGWNTSALFVRDRTLGDLLSWLPDMFRYTRTGETVAKEVAWSGSHGGRLYAARQGDFCQIWDPDQRFAPRVPAIIDGMGDGILRATRLLAVHFHGITSTYGFWLFDDKALVRHACFASGRMKTAHGDPLPIESKLPVPSWGHDEDFLWSVIEETTGIGQGADAPFEVVRVD